MEEIIDYSNLDIDTVKDICVVESKKCITVSEMFQKLSGQNSTYEFISDPVMATKIYDYGRQELVNLSMKHDTYYYNHKEEATYEALCVVVHYKKSKLQNRRLVLVAVMKAIYLEPDRESSNMLTFVRMYNIPCK